jgi:chorismate mutase/ribosomal protein S18 acetylase RimI-like enzyme
MSTEPASGGTGTSDEVDLVLRPGMPEDADAVADMFTPARLAAVPAMPPPVHTADEDRAWLREQFAGDREAWVAERDGVIVGFMLLERDWLHSVYVRAEMTGQGIGSALVDLAKSLRPDGLQLWVFETNTGAQRLYRRVGFDEVERTDGSGNEEKAPDIRMVWPGAVGELRRRINEVDDRLADLLNERAAITAEIQRRKRVPGHAGRDAEREAEIVARMAARAPNLGPERVREIMHTVISLSLDAAEHPPHEPPTRHGPSARPS